MMELVDRIEGRREVPERALAWLESPNDGARLAMSRVSDQAAIHRCLTVADGLHTRGEWKDLETERATYLERIASEVERRASAIADVDARSTGILLDLTTRFARIAALAFRGAAAQLRAGFLETRLENVQIRREPRGIAVVIAPWNAPAAIAAHKVASALAAGCPTILKPSEQAPLSCNLLADAVEAAGVPPGIFQMVHGGGDVGRALAVDPRVACVSLTGGVDAGRSVAYACASRLAPAQLELGGNNPCIVLAGADVEKAAEGIVRGLVTMNGQWCRAVGRVLVHASLEERLVSRVTERLRAIRIGSSLDPTSEMGPLINRNHAGTVRAQIRLLLERGGTLHGAASWDSGCFVAPALVSGAADPGVEIFGPVATVQSFATADEAIQLANEGPYGLAAYVFGPGAEPVARRVRAGTVKIDGVSLLALHPDAPRAAWGMSGLGDEGTRETLAFFCGTKVVGRA